jgi:hypothetical protein
MSAKSAAWLLPLLLSACFNKPAHPPVQALPPPSSTSPKPETTTVALPPSAVTIPPQPLVTAPPLQTARVAKPPARRRKPKAQPAEADPGPAPAAAPPAAAQQAAVAPPAVSAIGQLSSADPSDLRGETEESIKTTERALSGLGSKLNDDEQKTVAQIREYLKQAREALASGDLDGAHTLAAKAKVLLSELNG